MSARIELEPVQQLRQGDRPFRGNGPPVVIVPSAIKLPAAARAPGSLAEDGRWRETRLLNNRFIGQGQG